MSSSAIPPAPPPSPVQTAAAVSAVLTAVAGGDGAEALAKLPLGSLVSASVQSLEGKTLVQLVTGTGASLDMKLPLNLTLPPDAELSLQVILQNGLPALKLLSVNGRPLGAGAFPPGGLQGGGLLLPGAADLLAPGTPAQAGQALGPQTPLGRGDAVALGAAAPGALPSQAGPLGLTATVVRPAAAGSIMIPQGLGADGQPQSPQTPPPGFADLAPGTQLTLRIAGIAPPGGGLVPPLGNAAPGQPPVQSLPGQPLSLPQSPAGQPSPPLPGQPAAVLPGPPSAPAASAPFAQPALLGQPPQPAALPQQPPLPSGAPPPPSNGSPLSLPGNVIAQSPGGTALVQTPAGLISLPGGPPLPVGGSVQLEVVGPPMPPPPVASTNSQTQQGLGPNGWPTLSSAADVLAQSDRQAAEQLIRMIPQANPRLAAALVSFAGAVRSGDFKALGGDGAIKGLDRAGRRDLADRLKRDFMDLAEEAQRPRGNGDWQVVTLPFAHGADIDPIHLYVQRHKEEEEKGGKGQEQRFILEIRMSNLGRIQFDGLIQRDTKRFDLIIRTNEPLGTEICRDIGGIFAECGQLTGTKGTVNFQSGRPFVELPPCDAKGTRIMV